MGTFTSLGSCYEKLNQLDSALVVQQRAEALIAQNLRPRLASGPGFQAPAERTDAARGRMGSGAGARQQLRNFGQRSEARVSALLHH